MKKMDLKEWVELYFLFTVCDDPWLWQRLRNDLSKHLTEIISKYNKE